MRQILIVAAGGSLGAVSRYAVNGLMQRWLPPGGHPGGFPAATFTVNAVGCFLIGLIMAFVAGKPEFRDLQLLLVTGFLGGLTTFSAYGYETVELLSERNVRMAVLSMAGNVVVGLAAVWVGRTIGRQF